MRVERGELIRQGLTEKQIAVFAQFISLLNKVPLQFVCVFEELRIAMDLVFVSELIALGQLSLQVTF